MRPILRPLTRVLLCCINLATLDLCAAQMHSVRLADISWKQAAEILTDKSIIMLPLGAEAKEHGLHLKLSNDFVMAQYLTKEVMSRTPVVVAPAINYSFYPAFLEYPGSTSLRLETARDMVVDICRSLARYGPRKFYVLNTGVSTIRPLNAAADELTQDGLKLRFTNILNATADVEKEVAKQPEGTHADEIETSMMLYLAPQSVDMSKAAKDFPHGKGRLQWRDANAPGYSPSGVFGDASLATREKGERVTRALIDFIVREIEMLKAE
jgi:creatinine amidohydrolase